MADMIKKYEKTAQSTGALMFPQIGIESAPPDLVTWSLASVNKERFSAQTKDVTVAVNIRWEPSFVPSSSDVASD